MTDPFPKDVEPLGQSRPQHFSPWLVWLGVVVIVAGFLTGAAAVLAMSTAVGAVAIVLCIAGAITAWRGRIFRDTHGTTPFRRELVDLANPERRNWPRPWPTSSLTSGRRYRDGWRRPIVASWWPR